MSTSPVNIEIQPFGDIPLDIRVELDRLDLKLAEVMTLSHGHVISLPKSAGEPLDIYIGNVLFGSGEVVMVNENVGVRVTTYTAATRRSPRTQPWQDNVLDLSGLMQNASDAMRDPGSLERLLAEVVTANIVVGRAWMPLDKVLRLKNGSFLELESTPRQPAEIVINERVLATGEVVVVDGNYGIRIHSILTGRERLSAVTSQESPLEATRNPNPLCRVIS